MSLKSAVCLLVPLGTGNPKTLEGETYLAVSRRNDPSKWGLPGGKVDPGEHTVQALLRELMEEVHLPLTAQMVEPLYCGVCPGKGQKDTYWVTTYLLPYLPGTLRTGMAPEEGLTMSALKEEELTDPASSPFAKYNAMVFDALYRYRAGYASYSQEDSHGSH